MPSRRRVLAGFGTATTALLAGCNGLPVVGDTAGGGDDGAAVELGDDYPAAVGVDTGWPSRRRDPANTACAPDADPLPEPSVEWRTSSLPRGTRLTVDDATLVGGSKTTRVFDVISGDRLWSVETGGDQRAAVTIRDEVAYAAGATRRTGLPAGYLGIDVTSGERARAVELGENPVVGPTFARTGQRPIGFAPVGDSVVAWDGADEPVRWRRDVFGAIHEPLASNGRLVVAATSAGEVYAYGHDGSEGWRTDLDDRIVGPPVLGDARVYVPVLGGVVALDRYSGEPRWEQQVATQTSLALDGKRVFAAADTALVALSAKTGEVAWRHDFGTDVTTEPVVRGDSVYVGTGSSTGRLVSLTADGSQRWAVEPGGTVGALVTAGSRLYAMTRDENVRPHAVALE
jgi:outer membrane protein assembly factor BamB